MRFLFLSVFLILSACGYYTERRDQRIFDSLYLGMSVGEVIEIFGKYPAIDIHENDQAWTPFGWMSRDGQCALWVACFPENLPEIIHVQLRLRTNIVEHNGVRENIQTEVRYSDTPHFSAYLGTHGILHSGHFVTVYFDTDSQTVIGFVIGGLLVEGHIEGVID